MPAIEVHSGQSVGIALPTAEREGTLVPGRTHGGANTLVVLAVRIGEVAARPTELGLELTFRILQLAP